MTWVILRSKYVAETRSFATEDEVMCVEATSQCLTTRCLRVSLPRSYALTFYPCMEIIHMPTFPHSLSHPHILTFSLTSHRP